MKAKVVKYSVGIPGLILVLWLSLDVQNLEKHREAAGPAKFSAADYALKFWNEVVETGNSETPGLLDVIQAPNDNPAKGFERYGKKPGISKISYFMVQGEGKIEKVTDEYIQLTVNQTTNVRIATDFIYGNAVRDGSGKVNIDDFMNMTDFNAVSVAINKLVREKVVVRLRSSATIGKWMQFRGAFELSEDNMELTGLLILPVSAKLSDGKPE